MLVCGFLHTNIIVAQIVSNKKSVIPGDVDFVELNAYGDTIYYFYAEDIGSTNILVGEMANTTTPFITDSLIIPSHVTHNEKDHVVIGMVPNAFHGISNRVKSLTLPETFETFGESLMIGVAYSPFKNIYVEETNPHYLSDNGILYSKDMGTLVAYPSGRTDTMVIVQEGVSHIGKNAFGGNPTIKTIILPNTLKNVSNRTFFHLSSLQEILFQDSVEYIGASAFSGTLLQRLIFGAGIQEVHYAFLSRGTNPSDIDVFCYTLIPPKIEFPTKTAETTFVDNEYIHLFVPRAALTAYQRAAGWKDCASILPIEPPIVVGKDEAEVSWVQNFSATGYVWTLYTDEAKTQRFMSLTFDANGHLTRIDLNSSPAPERMATPDDDEEEEKRFAEYYSFTITGLSPETQYFYTRQSLKGTEVIDEESGSFTTHNTPTDMQDIDVNGNSNKILRDGHLLINHNGKTYDVGGQEIIQ
ncbi:MAG: leucine-rich repeat domain-containing protein [Paludibacteraceae bacterium]|nr:leucine-rich repeat domain-containing protein [Paludibacteraceae bacterium]